MIALRGTNVVYLVHPDTVELVEVEAQQTRLVTSYQTIIVDTDENLDALSLLCGAEDLQEVLREPALPAYPRLHDLPF
ncbi:hypothetical protein GCM10027275_22770 [Rhabdobacter roseus]|uniref:Uncharacterized protein n=1 Tax=Rhabdobacter roseus TaxID=1655419 RepID=A0A840TLC1_9BACT|nr:hypothetical protein [Rhabdobacter roseus]MBB5284214.1 hypothetical protein [Rhabdobacter roseus]